MIHYISAHTGDIVPKGGVISSDGVVSDVTVTK